MEIRDQIGLESTVERGRYTSRRLDKFYQIGVQTLGHARPSSIEYTTSRWKFSENQGFKSRSSRFRHLFEHCIGGRLPGDTGF
jgi:hypothetical protein